MIDDDLAQEDYIKKQIDRISRILGEALAVLIGSGQQRNNELSVENVQQVLQKELNIDTDYLCQLPNEETVRFLRDENSFSYKNMEELADILYLLSEKETQKVKRQLLFDKSLFLYNFIENNEADFSLDRHAKIERLKKNSVN